MQPSNRPRGGAHSKKKPTSRAAASPQKRSLKPQAPAKPLRLGSDVIYMTVLLAIAMLLSAGLLQNQLVRLMPAAGQSGMRALVLFVVYLIELVALSYCAYRHRERFVDFFRMHIGGASSAEGAAEKSGATQGWISVGLVVAFLVGLRLFSIGWTLFTEEIGWRLAGANDVLNIFGKTNFGLVVTILLVVVLAPVVEELVFRGLLQRWLALRLPAWGAIALTSVLFALYHLSFWAAPLNLALGASAGYLAHRCKTLYPAIALHVLYNATLVMAAFYLASH